MTNTVIQYVEEYGDYTFMEKPMNDVDSLILCQFSYLKFDGLVPLVMENKASVSVKQLAAHADYEHMFADERFERDNRALFVAMAASRRFGSLKLNCFIDIVETEWETQFSAVTFLLEDGTIYIAYRGTDETIVGWKEDFNMAFMDPVPGQQYSVKYLNMVTGRLHARFYVGGHSKGGNLAVYAAMNCTKQVQDRIIRVYSMDGPGFRPEILERCGYEQIADRIVKILPHSSLIGMLFGTDSRYYVVRSKAFGLLQHNPYSWLVEDDHFVRADDIYKRRKETDNTINEWILSLSETQVRTFVDTLYQVISASETDNLIDFTADWRKSMNGVIGALREVDEDTIKVLKTVVKELFNLGFEKLREQGNKIGKKKPAVGSGSEG